ncbi:hypothetical protein B9Z19DRAFT_1067905 [Tuber borchii]|uniref:Chromo domain-containing protein n=1 Tax=Tuber borchii TaxID=42251 RepID=A0A2T6ZH82_TUBBO|nr:hypothetical protein B9Z19DRAFT_1067905 [Tuber borchii]
MADILHQLQEALKDTQSRQMYEANKKRQPHCLQTGDKVLINTKNLPITYGNAGPEQDSKAASEYQLRWLRHSNIDHSRSQPLPPPIRVVQQAGMIPSVEYEVEKILDWRQSHKGVIEFQLKWVGLDRPEDITWEKQQAFTGAKETLSEFICQPENAELAHLLRWPRTTRVEGTTLPTSGKKQKAKGQQPSRRSARIQARTATEINYQSRGGAISDSRIT